MYYVKFILRNDTRDYEQTNLMEWDLQIKSSINEFNKKNSRLTDKAKMKLIDVRQKFFIVEIQIDERFNPAERSFYTRVGAVSRSLKQQGMHKMLSPHGKLFSLEVESVIGDNLVDKLEETEEIISKNIYVDCKNKQIMIPKEMVDKYIIKFY